MEKYVFVVEEGVRKEKNLSKWEICFCKKVSFKGTLVHQRKFHLLRIEVISHRAQCAADQLMVVHPNSGEQVGARAENEVI